MPARIGNVAFDCEDVLKIANFWSRALGRPIDDGGNAQFASIGGSDGNRAETAWYFNRVPETKQAKNRMHLDLLDPDPTAVASLMESGARVVGRNGLAGHSWTVMQDPEGNEFCIAVRSWTG